MQLPHEANKDSIKLPSDEVMDKLLSKAKIKLFYYKGATFLSTLMCNMKFVWSEEIPTAATDGKTIYWNPYFFISIDTEHRVFVLAHEIWHVAYQHILRRDNRDPQMFNIAGDHVINTMLISQGYKADKLGFKIYKEFKYHEWSVDRVYEDLMKNLPPPPPNGGGAGNQGNQPAMGSEAGYGLSDDIKTADGKVSDAEIVGNIVQAVQASKMAGEAGVIPGDIEQALNKFLNPILPWEVLLQNFLTEMNNNDYSYRRPSRRYDDPILPSLISDDELQELNWYVDVSGSISDHMLLRFFSEMVYVKETFNPAKINIIQFDTRISKVTELESGDSFDELKILGRGGTNLAPVRAHIMETMPNAAVIFSDMECDPMKEVPIPVLWAVFGKNSSYSHEPTFGTKINVIE